MNTCASRPMSAFFTLFGRKKKSTGRTFTMGDFVEIRSVSNVPLQLVQVEHFDPAESSSFSVQNATLGMASVTNSIGLTNSTTRAAVPQISPDAKPFATRDVSIRIDPFTIVKTDVHAFIKNAQERLRLTFQTDLGGKHRMYCPVPTTESASLEALAPNPKHRFTGIYLPKGAFVALYSSSNLDSWMQDLPDNTPMGALSIPGTHNSPTYHKAPPSVRCQAVSPLEQLKNGVRFFDLRVQVPDHYDPSSDELILVHAVFPISLTGTKKFKDLYHDIRTFLDQHPSETLIISFKREGTGKGTDEQLGHILKDHYTNLQQWFTQPRVPLLGEARGKAVLLRRFNLDDEMNGLWDGKGWGIPAAVWADNTPCATTPSGDVCVQDFYQVMESQNVPEKIKYCTEQMDRSGCCKYNPDDVSAFQRGEKKMPLYIDFLSASNFWRVDTWPEKIAARVNPACVEYLCRRHMVGREGEGDWSTGIVVCDWVGLDGDWDLVRCIVGFNSKLIQ